MKPIADISSWQKSRYIDYERLVKSVRGVILRCAYGLDKDTEFEGHYRRLYSLGMPLGVYHFPLDGNANAQVDLFGECIEGKYFELGGAVDVEHPPRPDRLSKATVDTFIADVRSRLDAKLAIYTTLYKWREIMRDSTDYASHLLWVANYGARVPALPVPWKKWCIWQYTNTGRVDGYASNIDLNYYNEACLEKIKPLGAYPVITPPEPEPEPKPELPFRARVVTPHGLAVRKAPSTQGEWVRWLYTGAYVTVYAVEGDWWRIDKVQSLWSASQYDGEVLMRREGKVEPEPITPNKMLAVPQYSQRDPRWSGIRLGTGKATIGQQGCLVTAVSAVCKFYGKDTDPARLNSDLLRVDGYANSNLYNWWSLPKIYPDIRLHTWIECDNKPAPLDRINAELAARRPPIVWVDFYPSTPAIEMHWVVIIGHTEGKNDYLIMDPWTGKVLPFRSLYSDPSRYIFRIVTYARR